jgi:hypothetical protein
MRVRAALPEHHVRDDSKRLIEMGLGIIGTMGGLLLSLLVASATASYNAQQNELLDISSKVVLLDRVLAHYGPDATQARQALRASVEGALARVWPKSGSTGGRLEPLAARPESVLDKIEDLTPKTDGQRSLKAEAVTLALNLLQSRWLIFVQTSLSISVPLLIVLVFWFTITFTGFGILAPSNATVILALALCAVAVSGAIFLILGMYSPYQGILQLSSEPLRHALAHLGR